MIMSNNLNFNAGGQPCYEAVSSQEIRHQLLCRLPSVLQYLLPNGRVRNHVFQVGDIEGTEGESLKIEMQAPKAGMWQDFATNEGGDIFDLWANVRGLDAKSDFPRLMEEIKNWLGVHTPFQAPIKSVSPPANKNANNDNLGKPSAEWSYTDIHGKIIAKKLRYDVNGEKNYLPWDEERKAYKMPKSRPLYNLPGINKSNKVILVEGEKCAQGLIDKGICATTVMGGANTDITKTDWSPLKGKHLIIWPDNDKVGKEYAKKVADFLKSKSLKSVDILDIPTDKPDKWDAADGVAEGIDVEEFLESATKKTIYSRKRIPIYKFKQYRNDNAPIAEDIISPRILTPKGLFVLGGAPKVGKSDYLVSWMTHMAAGIPFLDMTPARPLKIFFLQTEIDYDYLKERIKTLALDKNLLQLVGENLSLTPKVDVLLNEQGVEELVEDIRDHFQNDAVDIIVIDPLYDVFDSNGSDMAENDNNLMNLFLKNRIEYLRDQVNPQAGIIIAHHTRKITKAMLEEDPFQALAGASSLRRRFTSGAILYRPDESQTQIKVIHELRNGPKIANKLIDKIDGRWQELENESVRLVHQKIGNKLDAERTRKRDVILQLIDDRAAQGSVYTMKQFCEEFENKAGLGGQEAIRNRLNVLSTKGYIKFFKDVENYSGLARPTGTKFGYMCIKDMHLRIKNGDELLVYPTDYKCNQTGAVLPVENPKIWVYLEEENATNYRAKPL
jgi:putative DNA primase/helicase